MMHWLCSLLLLCSTPSSLPVISATLGTHTYQLELAADPEAREIGLMNRDSIGTHDGMLFVFPTPDRYRFWMKNTRIPLDIIFLDQKKRVLEIAHGEPQSLTQLGDSEGVVSVIELDAGRAARDGIALGDVAHYALPPSITVR